MEAKKIFLKKERTLEQEDKMYNMLGKKVVIEILKNYMCSRLFNNAVDKKVVIYLLSESDEKCTVLRLNNKKYKFFEFKAEKLATSIKQNFEKYGSVENFEIGELDELMHFDNGEKEQPYIIIDCCFEN